MVKHKKFVGWDFYEGWAFPNFVGRPKLLKTFWRKLPEHLKNNRPINAHLNFQEQKVAVFRDFLHFFISLILYIFFEYLGFFGNSQNPRNFRKFFGFFGIGIRHFLVKIPWNLKFPGLGFFFVGLGFSTKKPPLLISYDS